MKTITYFCLFAFSFFLFIDPAYSGKLIILLNGDEIITQGAWEQGDKINFFKKGKIESIPQNQIKQIVDIDYAKVKKSVSKDVSKNKADNIKLPVKTVEDLIASYGKKRIIGTILQYQDNKITIDINGRKKLFSGRPGLEFVTSETIRMDMKNIQASVSDFADIIENGTRSDYAMKRNAELSNIKYDINDSLKRIARENAKIRGQKYGDDLTKIIMPGMTLDQVLTTLGRPDRSFGDPKTRQSLEYGKYRIRIQNRTVAKVEQWIFP